MFVCSFAFSHESAGPAGDGHDDATSQADATEDAEKRRKTWRKSIMLVFNAIASERYVKPFLTPVSLLFYLIICLFIYLFVNLTVYLFIYLFMYVFVYFIYGLICLFIFCSSLLIN